MNKPDNEFENFMDMLVQELIAMPSEQLLEGQEAEAVKAKGAQLLAAATAEAGRRRLAAAKFALQAPKSQALNAPAVSVEEARRYIAQARNDERFTLAARGMEELDDEEVLRIYRQMKALESAGNPSRGEQ